MISHWNAERAIHLEIKAYKENQNKLKIENDDEKFDLSFHNDYVKFVDEATSSVKELREKLISNKFHI